MRWFSSSLCGAFIASFDKSNATLYIVLSVIFTISVPMMLFIVEKPQAES